jgi:oligosaccharide 4-alpha-D-glucosyltransferase
MDVSLPAGLWYDFFTGEALQGGVELRYPLRVETIPVFARAGSIIPRVEAVNTTDYYSSRRLYLHAYLPDGQGLVNGKMYEDDGWTYGAFETGAYELLAFNGEVTFNNLNLSLSRTGNGYSGMPESRLIEWIFYGLEKSVKSVVVDGRALTQQSADTSPNKTGFWRGYDGKWHIRVPYYGHNQQINISF